MSGFLAQLGDWLTREVDARSALVVVDVQQDFMPGGSLAVESGDEVVTGIRLLMEEGRFGVRVATQDWHPQGHISFSRMHPGCKQFETIELHGHAQTLWPEHCVQGTAGARLHPGLSWQHLDAIVRKGTQMNVDSYSAFRENWDDQGVRRPTGLGGYLHEREVKRIYVCGLARDVCCKWTARDAAAAGFQTYFLWDLTRPVDPSSNAENRDTLIHEGVEILEFV